MNSERKTVLSKEEEEYWKILLEKRGGKMRGFSEFKKFQNAITPI